MKKPEALWIGLAVGRQAAGASSSARLSPAWAASVSNAHGRGWLDGSSVGLALSSGLVGDRAVEDGQLDGEVGQRRRLTGIGVGAQDDHIGEAARRGAGPPA